jgi:DNA topoisomerase I
VPALLDAAVSLVYGSDSAPGIVRLGRARVHYRGPDGRVVRDPETLDRIRRLAIPPAWTDVWISLDPTSHLQATGRDAKGRKQARYHPAFRAAQEEQKFSQLVDFGECLPALRRRVAGDLLERNPTETRQTALVVHLLDTTAVRVGNEQYARSNRSFGLSTLRRKQAAVQGSTVRLQFIGKSGREHTVELTDRRVAKLIAACQDLPGQTLFSYLADDGTVHAVRSEHVNQYLRQHLDQPFTAKTFRTWIGTTMAAHHLAAQREPTKGGLLEAIDRAADRLGNTRAVCRASYVHPGIVDRYLDGTLPELWAAGPSRPTLTMSTSERRTLEVLRQLGRT